MVFTYKFIQFSQQPNGQIYFTVKSTPKGYLNTGSLKMGGFRSGENCPSSACKVEPRNGFEAADRCMEGRRERSSEAGLKMGTA